MNLNTSKNYNPFLLAITQGVVLTLCLSLVITISGAFCYPAFAQENAPDPIARVEATPTSIPVDNVTIEKVLFSGSKRYDVWHDTTQLAYPSNEDQPHWQINRNYQAPVCYLRNTRIEVSAALRVTPSNATKEVLIRASAGTYEFAQKEWTPENGEVFYPNTSSSLNLPNTIRPGDNFNIRWQWSKDGGTTWNDAGYSSNQLYVVLSQPLINKLYHTIVDVGCSSSAGHVYPDAIVNNIWGKFSNRNVTRIDNPVQLTYWANNSASAINTADLLKDGNGQCGSWAHFLQDCFSAQGISSEFKEIKPIYGGTSVFLVKNWSFDAVGTAPAEAAPFTHRQGEYSPQDGKAGQGNGNPPSDFRNHFLVKRNGVYYDSSYGGTPYPFGGATTVNALATWEDYSLDGFSDNFVAFDASGNATEYIFAKVNDLGSNNLETNPVN